MGIRVTPPIFGDDQLERLAVFPLSGAVLFPGALMPLHIFEPRYRQMTRDALAEGRAIAIAGLLPADPPPGGLPGLPARPPLLPVAGVGSIVHHEALPDGRFNLLLVGQGRVVLERELDLDTLYRQVQARWLRDDEEPEDALASRMGTVRQVVFGLHRTQPQLSAALAKLLLEELPPGAVGDALSNALFADPQDRQRLLEDTSPLSRLDRVIDRLLALLEPSSGGEPDIVH